MKSLYSIIQVFNMNNTVSCSIWNGYGKKRTPIYADFMRTEDTVYLRNVVQTWVFRFPLRVDKILLTGRRR